jgi:adenine-specific DNA-methyltransferase
MSKTYVLGYDINSDVSILSGDCNETLKSIPDESVHLLISSPPYNLKKEYETGKSLDAYLHEMKPILEECCRVLHPCGSLCWEVGNFVDRGEVYPLDIYYYGFFKKNGASSS